MFVEAFTNACASDKRGNRDPSLRLGISEKPRRLHQSMLDQGDSDRPALARLRLIPTEAGNVCGNAEAVVGLFWIAFLVEIAPANDQLDGRGYFRSALQQSAEIFGKRFVFFEIESSDDRPRALRRLRPVLGENQIDVRDKFPSGVEDLFFGQDLIAVPKIALGSLTGNFCAIDARENNPDLSGLQVSPYR